MRATERRAMRATSVARTAAARIVSRSRTVRPDSGPPPQRRTLDFNDLALASRSPNRRGMRGLLRGLTAAGLLLAAASAAAADFKIVVNERNPNASLSRMEVSDLLLKKQTRW